MTTFTVRNDAAEIVGSFLSEDEAFAYGSHLANANPDECYSIVVGYWDPPSAESWADRKPCRQ